MFSAEKVWSCTVCGAVEPEALECGCHPLDGLPRLQLVSSVELEAVRFSAARRLTRDILKGKRSSDPLTGVELPRSDQQIADNWRHQMVLFALVDATDGEPSVKKRDDFVREASFIGRGRAAAGIGESRALKYAEWLDLVPVEPQWKRSTVWEF